MTAMRYVNFLSLSTTISIRLNRHGERGIREETSYVMDLIRERDALKMKNADLHSSLKATNLEMHKWVGRAGALDGKCDALMAEREQAYGYLSRLLKACAPQCTPLDDLPGLAMQIDNYVAGLRAELQSWCEGGLTEEIPPNQDGYVKVGTGCMIVSAHYMAEKDAEIAALRAERDVAIERSTRVGWQRSGKDEEIEALKAALEWAKVYDPFSLRACPLCTYMDGTFVKPCSLHAEIAALKAKMEELERGEYICRGCGLRRDGEGPRGDF